METKTPEGRRDFDAAAATWDENPGRVRMARDVCRAIVDFVQPGPGADVLDFGCGTGLLTLSLRPHVRSVTAVDSSRGMLDVLEGKIRAQGIGNVTTRLVDLEQGGTLDGQFDLVVSSMTFHHIADVENVLCALAAVTKPGGTVAIADLDKDGGKFHETNEGVLHFGFDRCRMKKHFGDAGLVSVRNRTAAIVQKPAPGGGTGTFSVFLMTGKKPA